MSAVGDFLMAVFVWLLWAWAALLGAGGLLLAAYAVCRWFDRRPERKLAAGPTVARRVVDPFCDPLERAWELPCAPDPRRIA